LAVLEEHGKAWEAITGRPFNLVDTWGTEDADYVVVVLGSAAGNARHIARELRAQGRRVGVVRPKVFRPFPAAAIAEACKTARAVAVMDRSDSIGAAHGPLGAEVTAALHEAGLTMPVKNYIFGLGGQDLTNDLMTGIFDTLEGVAAGSVSPSLEYLGFNN
jgi:pyruvate ferredoxin oxidoreductase alpha subunit